MKYKVESFNLKDIFECGQCFRWQRKEDGKYEAFFKNKYLEIQQNGNEIEIETNATNEEIEKYFDLKTDYEKIKKEFSEIDENMVKSVEFGSGIRILNQDLFEMIISFIISANNNIPRIKGIIEKLCKKYGKKCKYKNYIYYSFPTVEELSKASIADFREIGMGFRDKRVYNTVKKIKENQIELEKLYNLTTDEIREELLKLDGVGNKVADCILLFSDLKRFDVFPIDVWIRRVMNNLYIHNEDEQKVKPELIQKIANEKFGELKGLAQQYLFYWIRENSERGIL